MKFGKFKVVHLMVVNDVTYDKRNSNWHFILLPNRCRSPTHTLTHARCDADEIERHQWPLQNVNIEKDLYQMFSHRKFCCVSPNGNNVSNTLAYGSVHVTCEWIFCFSGLCLLYSVYLRSIPSTQLHRWRFKSIKEKFSRGIHARIQCIQDVSNYVCVPRASNLIRYPYFNHSLCVHLQLSPTHLARRVNYYAYNFREVSRA